MYTKFTDEQVFLNADVNVFCNLVYEVLIKAIDLPTLEANLAMTGKLAEIIDGAPLEDLTVIPFGIKALITYEEITKVLPRAIGVQAAYFPDRIQFIWREFYFEFYHKPTMDIKTVSGLQIEVKP